MKIGYQSTLDLAQHPNYAKALAAHFRKIASSGTAALLHGRVGDPRNHLPTSEIIAAPVVYQSVVDPAFIRAVLASEEANSDAFIATFFSEPILPELRGLAKIPVVSMSEAPGKRLLSFTIMPTPIKSVFKDTRVCRSRTCRCHFVAVVTYLDQAQFFLNLVAVGPLPGLFVFRKGRWLNIGVHHLRRNDHGPVLHTSTTGLDACPNVFPAPEAAWQVHVTEAVKEALGDKEPEPDGMLLEWLTSRKVMKTSRQTQRNVSGFSDKCEILDSGPGTSLNPLSGAALHEFTWPKIPQVLVYNGELDTDACVHLCSDDSVTEPTSPLVVLSL